MEEEARAMDMTGMIYSLLFGLIGAGYFMFGKREGRIVHMGSGMALMVLPGFLPGISMVIVSLILCATPFLLRDV
jgi:threonine/homoserine efflux transporter RhtA